MNSIYFPSKRVHVLYCFAIHINIDVLKDNVKEYFENVEEKNENRDKPGPNFDIITNIHFHNDYFLCGRGEEISVHIL